MSQQLARRLVTWISAALGLIGLGVGAYTRARGVAFPLWAVVLVAYGGIYIIILPVNWVGQQFTRFRSEKDVLVARPRPPAGGLPSGQQLALEPSFVRTDDISVERVTEPSVPALQRLVDACTTELLALANQRPALDEAGHVVGEQAAHWLTDSTTHPLLIRYQQQTVGFCVLQATEVSYELRLLYVDSAWRRRRVATTALDRLLDFCRLLGQFDVIQVAVGANNARGQRFVTAAGFARLTPERAADEQSAARADTRYALPLHASPRPE